MQPELKAADDILVNQAQQMLCKNLDKAKADIHAELAPQDGMGRNLMSLQSFSKKEKRIPYCEHDKKLAKGQRREWKNIRKKMMKDSMCTMMVKMAPESTTDVPLLVNRMLRCNRANDVNWRIILVMNGYTHQLSSSSDSMLLSAVKASENEETAKFDALAIRCLLWVKV